MPGPCSQVPAEEDSESDNWAVISGAQGPFAHRDPPAPDIRHPDNKISCSDCNLRTLFAWLWSGASHTNLLSLSLISEHRAGEPDTGVQVTKLGCRPPWARGRPGAGCFALYTLAIKSPPPSSLVLFGWGVPSRRGGGATPCSSSHLRNPGVISSFISGCLDWSGVLRAQPPGGSPLS